MHQQIRLALGKASATRDGTGAMASIPVEVDPLEVPQGALVELLDLIAEGGYNLALAGGDAIESGGEFVFSLEDEDRIDECAQLLRDRQYRNVRVVEVHECEVEHRPGGLRDCLRQLADEGRRVDEIYVGVRREDGVVPVQVLTIREVGRAQA